MKRMAWAILGVVWYLAMCLSIYDAGLDIHIGGRRQGSSLTLAHFLGPLAVIVLFLMTPLLSILINIRIRGRD